jgi:hypothetical protein
MEHYGLLVIDAITCIVCRPIPVVIRDSLGDSLSPEPGWGETLSCFSLAWIYRSNTTVITMTIKLPIIRHHLGMGNPHRLGLVMGSGTEKWVVQSRARI